MTLEGMKPFAIAFIEADFLCNKAAYDTEISDGTYEQLATHAQAFFHSSDIRHYHRGITLNEVLADETWIRRFRKSLTRVQRRPLFRLQRFQNPTFGSALARHFTHGDLLAFDCGMEIDSGIPSNFSHKFLACNTHEGFKIVHRMLFSLTNGDFSHAHDHQPTQVRDLGTLVETLRLALPGEEKSQAEYWKP